jgi:isoamylase
MHVDGFRFDLASRHGAQRGPAKPLYEPAAALEHRGPRRSVHTKLIAEAWDAAGLYQVGLFPGDRWSRNGTGASATTCDASCAASTGPGWALASPPASPAAATSTARRAQPIKSINFVTCHDGFTLNDLVSYEHKHNEANGENNRDGTTRTTAGTAARRAQATIPR